MKKLILLVAFFATTAHAQHQVKLGASNYELPIFAADETTGAPKTDVTTWVCSRKITGGSPALCTGTFSENGDVSQAGMWTYIPDALETATPGAVVYEFSATGVKPFRKEIQVGGVSLSDASIKPSTYKAYTAQAATSTSITLDASETYASYNFFDEDGQPYNCVYIASGDTGVGQQRLVRAFNESTKVATVKAWDSTPAGTITYHLFPCVSGGASRGEW